MTNKESSKHTPSTSTSTPTFHSVYSIKRRHPINFPPEGRTKQSFKDECDINRIMGRFARTGVIDHINQRQPLFQDVADIDFASCMAVVVDARTRFEALPSDLRDRFANDPARLLAFLQDPRNKEEGIKLGLLANPDAPPTFNPLQNASQAALRADLNPQAPPVASPPAPAPAGA